jgi:hypothetical protein
MADDAPTRELPLAPTTVFVGRARPGFATTVEPTVALVPEPDPPTRLPFRLARAALLVLLTVPGMLLVAVGFAFAAR